ncbi:MAG: AmmeMemoRadiSam system protein A [Candidatus Cloacimonetes bacterium]|nr:AmmeMemoRadiSam system protein A [Candidatus Cloacimonadota bacterium]
MLTEEQKKFLLRLARESILAHLERREIALKDPTDQILKEKRGAFVTLHKKDALRGCIGYIKPYKPLLQTIKEMARAAAFQDPRFPSVTLKEIDDIYIEISILSELIPVSKEELDDITVGRDGLYIEGLYGSGLLLPQVAVEWNWDRETFLKETCHKAGLSANSYLDPKYQVYRFTAEIFSEEK